MKRKAILTSVTAVTPVPSRGRVTFSESTPTPNYDPHWSTGVAGLRALIADMRIGARPAHAEALGALATDALASVRHRDDDIHAWANALASEVGDLDD